MSGKELRSKDNNAMVAETLREAAVLLAQQNANSIRVSAYSNAANTIEDLPEDIAEVSVRGSDALDALPHVGKSIAAAIIQLTTTGRWAQLNRMRGTLDPEIAPSHASFTTICRSIRWRRLKPQCMMEGSTLSQGSGSVEAGSSVGDWPIFRRGNLLYRDKTEMAHPPLEIVLDVIVSIGRKRELVSAI